MELIGTLIIWAGLILMLLGAVAFLVAAFRESILWGLGCLLLPLVSLVFLVLHWGRARNGFFLQLWGWGIMLLGGLVFEARLPFLFS